jgi:hypothetical protein
MLKPKKEQYFISESGEIDIVNQAILINDLYEYIDFLEKVIEMGSKIDAKEIWEAKQPKSRSVGG